MRKIIISILKSIESKNTTNFSKALNKEAENDWSYEDYRDFERKFTLNNKINVTFEQFNGEHQKFITVREFMDFPNLKFIIASVKNFNDIKKSDGTDFTENSIKSEIKRMEHDGLILFTQQETENYLVSESQDFTAVLVGDSWKAESEGIILTTKGKNRLNYLQYQLEEQRFAVLALFMSFLSLVISALSINFDRFL